MFADYKSRHFTKVVNGEINHWLDFEMVGNDEGFLKRCLKCFEQSGRWAEKNCGIFGEGCPLNVVVDQN